MFPDLHLTPLSPCIGAGSSIYASGVDMDGEPWRDPPSIGADEYWPAVTVGSLNVAVRANFSQAAVGWPVLLQGAIRGRITSFDWDFGNGTGLSNQMTLVKQIHPWTTPGTYTVRLTAYNNDHLEGVSATTLVQVLAAIQCVNAASPNPAFPYTTWETAAATIQDAMGAVGPGGLVLVTNGVYDGGGATERGEYNRVVMTPQVTLRSLNGPSVTILRGDENTRCVYLATNTVLSGFTLTNGAAAMGGGVIDDFGGGVITNCVLAGNRAVVGGGAYFVSSVNCIFQGNSASDTGGGALGSTLVNCLLTDNTAAGWGGGADYTTLYNCTVTRNSAPWAGGVSGSVLENCIVDGNTAEQDSNHATSTIEYSCTLPLPPGEGNITNAPAFVNPAAGNFRLQYSSACVDAGRDLGDMIHTDLDGMSRPLDGRGNGHPAFDMGAYEFDLRAIVPPVWFRTNGLDATDPLVLWSDPDHDGLNTWQEWQADTNPTNAASVLRLTALSSGPSPSISIPTSPNRLYTLLYSTSLTGPWLPVPTQTDLPGTGAPLTFQDPDSTPPPVRFYRLSVKTP